MYSGRFKPKPVENEYGVFDSKSEYERYLLLLDMERNGLITDLKDKLRTNYYRSKLKLLEKLLKLKLRMLSRLLKDL